MQLTGINHLAFITGDMVKTIRFYRDLLGMELVAGIGHPGYRHYFFSCGNTQVAFFESSRRGPVRQFSVIQMRTVTHIPYLQATCLALGNSRATGLKNC